MRQKIKARLDQKSISDCPDANFNEQFIASQPVEIAKNVYWVGTNNKDDGLEANAYLIIDQDEGVLIDPGSVLDYEIVCHKIKQLIPLSQVKYIILHHQDPDLCAGVPLLEKEGINAQIVTHWRSAVLIKFYGVKSPFYMVNENQFELTLSSGRKLDFLLTPYCHFPGAIVTYDPQTKTLFSSDLFGAISFNWTLYAGDDYAEAMSEFHENYMPSREILAPVIEQLEKLDIALIAPQHGSIIKNEFKKYMDVLKHLECGGYLSPIKKELAKNGGFSGICNQVLKRLYAVFSISEVTPLFKKTDIKLDSQTGLIIDYNSTGRELWDKLFQIIYSKKGIAWITPLEIFVQKLCHEYEIDNPAIFNSVLASNEKVIEKLNQTNQKLAEQSERLKSNQTLIEKQLTTCPITGLYNEDFFFKYMEKEARHIYASNENAVVCLCELDGLSELILSNGITVEDESIKAFSYLITRDMPENHQLFKLDGALFAYYIPNTSSEAAIKVAEALCQQVSNSKVFAVSMTVSVGCITFSELSDRKNIVSSIMHRAKQRLIMAKKAGGNTVFFQEKIKNDKTKRPILIVDPDKNVRDVLASAFEKQRIPVIFASDGQAALVAAELQNPCAIIAELMLPKLDAFLLKEQLQHSSVVSDMPFILMSHSKDENTIVRALALNINHFFHKPFNITEIIGVTNNLTRVVT